MGNQLTSMTSGNNEGMVVFSRELDGTSNDRRVIQGREYSSNTGYINPGMVIRGISHPERLALPPEMATTSSRGNRSNLVSENSTNRGSATAGVLVGGDIRADNINLKQVRRNIFKIQWNAASTVQNPERIFFNVHESIPSFTGQQEVIEKLHKDIYLNELKPNLGIRARMKVICGIAGVGKTQTVRHYIQSYEQCYDHVIWINAEKHSETMSGFVELANNLQIDVHFNGQPKKEEAILQEIFDLVCTKPTLIVYDNVESYDTSGENDLRVLLPQRVKAGWKVPVIIVTTRNRNWKNVPVIELAGLTKDESFLLLLSRLKLIDSEETRRLVNDITDLCQGLPLVLQLVVSVIRYNVEIRAALYEEPYTLQDFLAEMKVESYKKRFLSTKADEYETHDPLSVFQMAFNQLSAKENGPLALKCLDLMALLKPNDIPTALFVHIVNSYQADENRVAGALNLLHSYNLVSRMPGSYQIHPTIQDVRRASKDKYENKAWHERVNIEEVVKSFSGFLTKLRVKDNYDSYRVMMNGLYILDNFQTHIDDEIYYQFKKILAVKLNVTGKYADAERLFQEILKFQNGVHGSDHPEMLKTQHNLADVMESQGKYDEAEDTYRAVLLVQSEVLGPEHPATLGTQQKLGSVIEYQGRYDKAEEHYRAVLEARKNLGPEHPDTFVTLNNLANVMESQGKFEAALELYTALLETRNKVLQPEDRDAFVTQENLARLMLSQGKYDAAEELHRAVMEARNRIFASEHPGTHGTRHNPGSVIDNKEKYNSVEDFYRELLDSRQDVLGFEHPQTSMTQCNLAYVLQSQGKYDAAEELYRAALETEKKVLGPEHPETLCTLESLASLLYFLKRFNEAEERYSTFLEAKRRILGHDHLDVVTTMHNLALVKCSLEKFGDAEQLYTTVLDAQNNAFGPEHAHSLTTKNNLASVLHSKGQHKSAEELYTEVLAIRMLVLGAKHPHTITTMHNLASVMFHRRKYQPAEELFRKVLGAQKQIPGAEHPDTLTTEHNIASVMGRLGQHKAAEELYRHVLEIRERSLGSDDLITITTRSCLASVMKSQRKYKEAEMLSRNILEARNRLLGPDHPDTIVSANMMARVLLCQGRNDEAQTFLVLVRDIRMKNLGPYHPDAIHSQKKVDLVAYKIRRRRHRWWVVVIMSFLLFALVVLLTKEYFM